MPNPRVSAHNPLWNACFSEVLSALLSLKMLDTPRLLCTKHLKFIDFLNFGMHKPPRHARFCQELSCTTGPNIPFQEFSPQSIPRCEVFQGLFHTMHLKMLNLQCLPCLGTPNPYNLPKKHCSTPPICTHPQFVSLCLRDFEALKTGKPRSRAILLGGGKFGGWGHRKVAGSKFFPHSLDFPSFISLILLTMLDLPVFFPREPA